MREEDLLNKDNRLQVIKDIKSDENKRRKNEHLRRFEIYQERQGPYIEDRLLSEFDKGTVDDMRKILSINLAPRIINAQASLYTNEVERLFTEVTEKQEEQCENLYRLAKSNRKFKKSNRYFKLSDQNLMQVIPSKGVIELRPILQHLYDVVPDENDNEIPMAVILSTFDKSEAIQDLQDTAGTKSKLGTSDSTGTFDQRIDGVNQVIADGDDYQASLERYIVWTNSFHFTMNGLGHITSEKTDNPIGILPFVDVADDKDQEYFCRKGNNTIDFVLDFGLLLSDTANIHRMQSYAQAIVSAEKMPQDMRLGPNRVMFLKINPQVPEISPKFEFVAPNVDLNSSLDLLEVYLKLFMSSKGLDPKMISSKSEGQTFASGLDRLLHMIQLFESTKDDMDLFTDVEASVFEILVKWSNLFQNVKDGLKPDLKIATIPETARMEVIYKEPSMIKSQKEIEDSVFRQLDEGLMSRTEAVAKIRGISEDAAAEIVKDLDQLIIDSVNNNATDKKLDENEDLKQPLES